MFQFAQRRKLYFLISASVIIPGLIAMTYSIIDIGSPVRLSIDFTGGTLMEVPLVRDVSEQEVRDTLQELGIDEYIVQQLDPKGIQTSGGEAASRWQIAIPDTDGLNREPAVEALKTYFQESETLGGIWTPPVSDNNPEPEPSFTSEFPETGGAVLHVAFVNELERADLEAILAEFGLVDFGLRSESATLVEADATDQPGSEWRINIQDTDLVKVFLENPDLLGNLWSPSSEEDDPNRQDSLVSRIKGISSSVQVALVNDVDADTLSTVLAESGLANFTVERLDSEDTEAGSRWQIDISQIEREDLNTLKTVLQEAEELGGLWSPLAPDAEAGGAAPIDESFVIQSIEGGVIVVDVSFVNSVDEQAVRDAMVDSGLADFELQEMSPLSSEAGSRWQIRMDETDRQVLERIKSEIQAPERLGEFWSPESLKADPTREDAFNSSTVSATVGEEVTRAAILATLAVAVIVLGFIVFAFRRVPHAFRYGACAIIAMFHDIFITMGIMSILGIFFDWEADALFLTAILTVVGFSVQDSIVVFDRIRENIPKYRGEEYEMIVNRSVLETIHRSLATQLNAIFVMVAILLFGGETIQQFIAVLLIGLTSGTYSSIFNAVPLLVSWEKGEIPFVNREAKQQRRREEEEAASAS